MKIALLKQGSTLFPHTESDMQQLQKLSDAIYEVDLKNMSTRTIAQNRAMHLWCKQIADTLNSKGLYMVGVFGNNIEWTMELVKTQIVKSTIKKVFNISSTTKLKRKEIDQLIDFITDAFASRGVTIPRFPSRESWND